MSNHFQQNASRHKTNDEKLKIQLVIYDFICTLFCAGLVCFSFETVFNLIYPQKNKIQIITGLDIMQCQCKSSPQGSKLQLIIQLHLSYIYISLII